MFNKVIIVGNLTRDIELRYTPSGTAVGSTGIASTRKFKGSDGAQKEEVLFVDITFFGRTAEIANQYLRKGSQLLIEGRLKLDSWTDQNGGKRSKHTVVVENMTMLGGKNSSDATSGYNNPQAGSNQPYQQQSNATPSPQQSEVLKEEQNIPEIDIDEEEIPF
jgi:single-strand DNA-binding protein